MSEFVELEEFPKYFINEDGVIIGKRGKPLTQRPNVDGYPVVCIRHGGKRHCKRVHRLLAQTFIPNPDNLPVVNHLDGNKENYSLSNLEWTTGKENMEHASKVLKVMVGNRTFTEEQIHEVCKLMESGKSNKEISTLTGITLDVLTKVRAGTSWKHISCEYNLNLRVGKILVSDIYLICEKVKEGLSAPQIVDSIGKPEITVDIVKRIRSGATYYKYTKDILFIGEKRPSTIPKGSRLK